MVSQAMKNLFGMSKNGVNGCLYSYNYVSVGGLVHHLTSNVGSYNHVAILKNIILGYYLLEIDKSTLWLIDGRILFILNQINVKASPTLKSVPSLFLVEPLHGLDKVKSDKNVQFIESVILLQVMVIFGVTVANGQFLILDSHFSRINSQPKSCFKR